MYYVIRIFEIFADQFFQVYFKGVFVQTGIADQVLGSFIRN